MAAAQRKPLFRYAERNSFPTPKPTVKLDALDVKILDLLQNDAELSVGEIASRVGLSSTPCWRRIQRLKDEKVITRQVALLDPHKVQVGVTVFVSVRTSTHTQE